MLYVDYGAPAKPLAAEAHDGGKEGLERGCRESGRVRTWFSAQISNLSQSLLTFSISFRNRSSLRTASRKGSSLDKKG